MIKSVNFSVTRQNQLTKSINSEIDSTGHLIIPQPADKYVYTKQISLSGNGRYDNSRNPLPTNPVCFSLSGSYILLGNQIGTTNEYKTGEVSHFINYNQTPSPPVTSTYNLKNVRIPANDYENAIAESINIVKNDILDNSACTMQLDTVNVGVKFSGLDFIDQARTVLLQFINAGLASTNRRITANSYIMFLKDISYILSNIRRVNAVAYCKYNAFSQRIEFTFCDRCQLPVTPAYDVLDPTMSPHDAHDKGEYQTNLLHFAILQSPLTTNMHAGMSSVKTILHDTTHFSGQIPLLYKQNFQSDTPTFDINDPVGSNGQNKSFVKITYDTYNVVDNYDVAELFNIKEGELITYNQFFSALCFIFEQWRNNLKNVNVELYLCHYNCHGNKNSNGNTTTSTIPYSGNLIEGYIDDDSANPPIIEPFNGNEPVTSEAPTVVHSYNSNEIMFVLRYRNFNGVVVSFPNSANNAALSQFAEHEYEKNFKQPTFMYSEAAAASNSGGGNDVIIEILNKISMTRTYILSKTDNPKEKNIPYIVPITINYPVLNDTTEAKNYQFKMQVQVSSFHSDYYGEIYESPDSTSISPKMHAFQFSFLAADNTYFIANNTPSNMRAIRTNVFKQSHLSDFACDSITLDEFTLQNTTRNSQDNIYILNDMIVDSLSVYGGRMDAKGILASCVGTYDEHTITLYDMLTSNDSNFLTFDGLSSAIEEANIDWPPTGKSVASNDDWYLTGSRSYNTKYLNQWQEAATGAEGYSYGTTSAGVRAWYNDKVAPLSSILSAVAYLKSYISSLYDVETLEDLMEISLPHGNLLIRPISCAATVTPDKYISIVSGKLLVPFKGMNFINSIYCYKRLRVANGNLGGSDYDYEIGDSNSTFTYRTVVTLGRSNDVITVTDEETHEVTDTNELAHTNNSPIYPSSANPLSSLDPTEMFKDDERIEINTHVLNKSSDLMYSFATKTYSTLEETVMLMGFGKTYFTNATVGDKIVSEVDTNIKNVHFKKIDSMVNSLSSALKTGENLLLKITVNQPTINGSMLVPIEYQKKAFLEYQEFEGFISNCASTSFTMSFNYNISQYDAFETALFDLIGLSEITNSSANNIPKADYFSYKYGSDYVLINNNSLQEVFSSVVGSPEHSITTHITGLCIIPTEDARRYFSEGTLLNFSISNITFNKPNF